MKNIMKQEDLATIQKKIGYAFENTDLLQQAFVRKSFANENGGESNEVLEFIGDKVLDLVIVKLLIEMYGHYYHDNADFNEQEDFDEFSCEKTEGQLTSLKKSLVEKKTLAKVTEELDLQKFLIMGNGDIRRNVQNETSVKEDLLEAIIGAITLDCDWDWNLLSNVIEKMLHPRERLVNSYNDNYVELIQEWSLRNCGKLPEIYTYYSPNYYDQSCYRTQPTQYHPDELQIKVFTGPLTYYSSKLNLEGINQSFSGNGKSKKEAQKEACELAYHYLEKNNLLNSIRNEIERPKKDDAISQLEILARRGYFSIPTYKYEQKYNKNGDPVWIAECRIKEYDKTFRSISSLKKSAKKNAAFRMLKFVLKA